MTKVHLIRDGGRAGYGLSIHVYMYVVSELSHQKRCQR